MEGSQDIQTGQSTVQVEAALVYVLMFGLGGSYPPPPPPCASTAKVRKTTVTWGPRA